MKLPTPIENLYADLRDRRMLSIAIVLVGAIIAVPFLLGGSGEEEIPPPPSVTAGAPFDGDEELNPVVLTEVPGLRDFHQRLAGYKSENPFKDKAPPIQKDNGGSGDGSGTGTDAGVDTGTTDETGTDVPVTIPGDTGSSDTSVPPDTGDTGDTGSTGGETEVISYRIDVRVGPLGDSEVVKDVEQLEFLPDRRDPLVQYLDSNIGGTAVAFIVNPAAAALRKGSGECVRSRKQCQYLIMHKGEEMNFLFNDREYRIELKDIVEHREPYEPQDGSDDGEEQSPERTLQEILGG